MSDLEAVTRAIEILGAAQVAAKDAHMATNALNFLGQLHQQIKAVDDEQKAKVNEAPAGSEGPGLTEKQVEYARSIVKPKRGKR